MTILVVDDEPDILEEIRDLCETFHRKCITASSANEAFSILEKRDDISVVLTDMKMPELSGLDLIDLINRYFEKGKFQIYIMSGHHDSDDVLSSHGVSGVIKKPFRVSELEGLLGKIK